MLINDFPLGRNIDGALRIIEALQHHEKYGEVCPANWEEDKEAREATLEGASNATLSLYARVIKLPPSLRGVFHDRSAGAEAIS